MSDHDDEIDRAFVAELLAHMIALRAAFDTDGCSATPTERAWMNGAVDALRTVLDN